jgi:hypothetical protein
MELSFLGKKYSARHQSINAIEGEVAGKYMGSPWRAKRYEVPKQSCEIAELQFMGRPYNRCV